MTMHSRCEYSVFVETMSGDELSNTHNDDRQAEPSLITKRFLYILMDVIYTKRKLLE